MVDTFELNAKITAPIVWDSNSKSHIVQDLQSNKLDEVLKLVKNHYLDDEPMCRSIGLASDERSVDGSLDLVTTWIKDTTSLAAISRKSGRVVGVALTRINSEAERTNTFSRVQIFLGEKLESIMHLKSTLMKQAHPYEGLESREFLRVYILCVQPSYRKHNVARSLLESCLRVAKCLKMPAVGGIFTSRDEQVVAQDLGFNFVTEIRYNRWIVDDEVVFADPGPGNSAAAFMRIVLSNSNDNDVDNHNNKNENNNSNNIAM